MSAWNGSGVFVISGSGLPYVGATVISSTVANQLNTDLATGLTNTICKDGQSTPTANIPFGGFKLTNVGAATALNDALTYGTGANQSSLLAPTRQVLTSGTTYTLTSPNIRQLRIRMSGGSGGSGATNGTDGGDGGDTTFNSIVAKGGGGGKLGNGAGAPGAAGGRGVGGTGSASFRAPGQPGMSGINVINGTSSFAGAMGGTNLLGITGGSTLAVSGFTGGTAGSGGGPEYAELIINSPSATYSYVIGAAGTGGTGSVNGVDGTNGVIIVDEFY